MKTTLLCLILSIATAAAQVPADKGSWEKAVKMFPALNVEGSELRVEMSRMIAIVERDKDPVAQSPHYYVYLAVLAERNLRKKAEKTAQPEAQAQYAPSKPFAFPPKEQRDPVAEELRKTRQQMMSDAAIKEHNDQYRAFQERNRK